MEQSKIRDVLDKNHIHWKQTHVDKESIQSLLESWTDTELISIGRIFLRNFSESKDPESWIWGKLIYIHYYMIHRLKISDKADTFIHDADISDFEKLVRITRLILTTTHVQESTKDILGEAFA